MATTVATPTLGGTVDDPTATIQVIVDGIVYAATNNGDGTWTLPGAAILVPLTAGIYDVQAAATDAAGNTGSDDATRDLTINPTVARQTPAGSLVYAAPIVGSIANAALADSFTIALNAGQTLTLIVTPASSLQATAQLLAPDGSTLGSATGAAPGDAAVVQTVAVAAAGAYTIRIGSANGTTGSYTAQVVLNAAAESELYGGANNTLATAQDISASFIPLGAASGDRGAVLGSFSAVAAEELLVNGDFETGNFNGWTATSTGGSQLTPWTVSPAYGGYFFNSHPFSGNYDALNGFDGMAGLQYQLYQNVAIPADSTSAVLTTHDRIVYSANGTGTQNRTFQITLRNTAGAVLQTLYTQQNPAHSGGGDRSGMEHAVVQPLGVRGADRPRLFLRKRAAKLHRPGDARIGRPEPEGDRACGRLV